MKKRNFLVKPDYRLIVIIDDVGSKSLSFSLRKRFSAEELKKKIMGFLRMRRATFKTKPNRDMFGIIDLKNDVAYYKRFTLNKREDPAVLLNDILNFLHRSGGVL